MTLLCLRNRQRTRSIDLRLLRKIIISLLKDILEKPQFELGIHLIDANEMATVNETFLQHHGSTDVITFDYNETKTKNELNGEIFISIDDAVKQSKQFHTSWQSELARYIIHGILHLEGFDDLEPASRKKMKRAENEIVTKLERRFPLSKLQRQLRKKR